MCRCNSSANRFQMTWIYRKLASNAINISNSLLILFWSKEWESVFQTALLVWSRYFVETILFDFRWRQHKSRFGERIAKRFKSDIQSYYVRLLFPYNLCVSDWELYRKSAANPKKKKRRRLIIRHPENVDMNCMFIPLCSFFFSLFAIASVTISSINQLHEMNNFVVGFIAPCMLLTISHVYTNEILSQTDTIFDLSIVLKIMNTTHSHTNCATVRNCRIVKSLFLIFFFFVLGSLLIIECCVCIFHLLTLYEWITCWINFEYVSIWIHTKSTPDSLFVPFYRVR